MENKFRIIDAAISYGIIEEKDKSLYSIAVSSLLFTLLTWGTFLLLGIFFQKTYGCLIFLLFHIPLRIYAGGFHQNTRGKCYAQSLVIFFLVLFGATTAVQNWIMVHWIMLVVLAIIPVWFLAPVEAMNKPLNPEERKHYKLVARSILLTEIIVLGFFAFCNAKYFLYFAIVSIEIVAIQLISGVIECKLFPDKG